MATPPNFLAYVVEDRGEGVKANWREVAAVWSHRNDNGFDLIIPAGISLSGRIVIMERKDKPDRPADEQPRQRRDRGEEPAGRAIRLVLLGGHFGGMEMGRLGAGDMAMAALMTAEPTLPPDTLEAIRRLLLAAEIVKTRDAIEDHRRVELISRKRNMDWLIE